MPPSSKSLVIAALSLVLGSLSFEAAAVNVTDYLPPCPTITVVAADTTTGVQLPASYPLSSTPTVAQASITDGSLVLTFTITPCGDLVASNSSLASVPIVLSESDVAYYGSKENAVRHLQCTSAVDAAQRSQIFTVAAFDQNEALWDSSTVVRSSAKTWLVSEADGSTTNYTTVIEESSENSGTVENPFTFTAISQQALMYISESQLAAKIGVSSDESAGSQTPLVVTEGNSSTTNVSSSSLLEEKLLSMGSTDGLSFLPSSMKYSLGSITILANGTTALDASAVSTSAQLTPTVTDSSVPSEPLGFAREVNTAAIYCESYFVLRRETTFVNGTAASSTSPIVEKRNVVRCYLPESANYRISEPEGLFIAPRNSITTGVGVFSEQCYLRNYGLVVGSASSAATFGTSSSSLPTTTAKTNFAPSRRLFHEESVHSTSSNLTALSDAAIAIVAGKLRVQNAFLTESSTLIIQPASSTTVTTRALQIVSAVTASASVVGAILTNQGGLPLQLQVLAVMMSNPKCSSPSDRRIMDVGLSFFLSPFLLLRRAFVSSNIISTSQIEGGTGVGILYDDQFYLTLLPVALVVTLAILQLMFIGCCRGILGSWSLAQRREEDLEARKIDAKRTQQISDILSKVTPSKGQVVTTPSNEFDDAVASEQFKPGVATSALVPSVPPPPPPFLARSMQKLWWLLRKSNPSTSLRAYMEAKDVDGVVLQRQIAKNSSYVADTTIVGAFGSSGANEIVAEDLHQATRQKIERARFLYRTRREQQKALADSQKPPSSSGAHRTRSGGKKVKRRAMVVVNIDFDGGLQNDGPLPEGLTELDYGLLTSHKKRTKQRRPLPATLLDETDSEHSEYYFDEAIPADGAEYHFVGHQRQQDTGAMPDDVANASGKYKKQPHKSGEERQKGPSTLIQKVRQICDTVMVTMALNEKVTHTVTDQNGTEHTHFETRSVTKSSSPKPASFLNAAALMRFPSLPAFLSFWFFTGVLKASVGLIVSTSSTFSTSSLVSSTRSSETTGDHLTTSASTLWIHSARYLSQYVSADGVSSASASSEVASTSSSSLPSTLYFLLGLGFVIVVFVVTPLLVRFRSNQGYYQAHWELHAVPLHQRWVFPSGVWLPTQFRHCYAGLFGGYNHGALYWHSYGFFISIATVVTLVAVPISVSCELRYLVLFGLFMISSCWILLHNPYRAVGTTVFTSFVEGMLAMYSLAQVGALMLPSLEMEGFKSFVLVALLTVVFLRTCLGIWSYAAVEIAYIRQWKAAEDAVVREIREIIRFKAISELEAATRRIAKLVSGQLGLKSIYTCVEKIAIWETEREYEATAFIKNKAYVEKARKVLKHKAANGDATATKPPGTRDGSAEHSDQDGDISNEKNAEDPGIWEGHGDAPDVEHLSREELEDILRSNWGAVPGDGGVATATASAFSGTGTFDNFAAFSNETNGDERPSSSALPGTQKWSSFSHGGWNPNHRSRASLLHHEEGPASECDDESINKSLEDGAADNFIISAMAEMAKKKKRVESAGRRGRPAAGAATAAPVAGMPLEDAPSSSLFDIAMVDGDSDDSSDEGGQRRRKGKGGAQPSMFNFFSRKKDRADDDDSKGADSENGGDAGFSLPGLRKPEKFDEQWSKYQRAPPGEILKTTREGISNLLPTTQLRRSTESGGGATAGIPTNHAMGGDDDDVSISTVSTPPLSSEGGSSLDTFESVPSTNSSTPPSTRARRVARQQDKKNKKRNERILAKRKERADAAARASGRRRSDTTFSRASSSSSIASCFSRSETMQTPMRQGAANGMVSSVPSDNSAISIRSFHRDDLSSSSPAVQNPPSPSFNDDPPLTYKPPVYRRPSLTSTDTTSSPGTPPSPLIDLPPEAMPPALELPSNSFGRALSYEERRKATDRNEGAILAALRRNHDNNGTSHFSEYDTIGEDVVAAASPHKFDRSPTDLGVHTNATSHRNVHTGFFDSVDEEPPEVLSPSPSTMPLLSPGSPSSILRRGPLKQKSNRSLRFSIVEDDGEVGNKDNQGVPHISLASLQAKETPPQPHALFAAAMSPKGGSAALSSPLAGSGSLNSPPLENTSFILIRSNSMFGGNVTVDSTKVPRSRSFRKLLAQTVGDGDAVFYNSNVDAFNDASEPASSVQQHEHDAPPAIEEMREQNSSMRLTPSAKSGLDSSTEFSDAGVDHAPRDSLAISFEDIDD